jgi:hypothetical protein
MKALRWTGYFGTAAALVYIVATGLGSVLDPQYSQLSQHVSDLSAAGAPTRLALAPVYGVYNLLAFGFALGLYRASDRSRLFKVGFALLTVNALAGIMMVFPFREDLPGGILTALGKGHIAWASVSSLVIVVGSFVYGFAFRRQQLWRPLSVFSFVIGVAFLILGPLAVVATAKDTLVGLAERGSIGVFIVWLLVVSLHALIQGRRGKRRGQTG